MTEPATPTTAHRGFFPLVRGDEVEASWRLWQPILDLDDHPVHPYAAGTWGPAVTNPELAFWTDEWTMRT